jgi:hypothetical protein
VIYSTWILNNEHYSRNQQKEIFEKKNILAFAITSKVSWERRENI